MEEEKSKLEEEKGKAQLFLRYKRLQDFALDLEKRLSGSKFQNAELGQRKFQLSDNRFSNLFVETVIMAYKRLCKAVKKDKRASAAFGQFKKYVCQVLILQEVQSEYNIFV